MASSACDAIQIVNNKAAQNIKAHQSSFENLRTVKTKLVVRNHYRGQRIMTDLDFEQSMQAVRLRFRNRLSSRLDTFRDLVSGNSSPEIEHLRRLLHDLAGTAPSLGFVEIGSTARLLEYGVEPAARAQRSLSAEEISTLAPEFSAFEALLERTICQ